jgi:hypothetical protein
MSPLRYDPEFVPILHLSMTAEVYGDVYPPQECGKAASIRIPGSVHISHHP